MLRHTLVLIAFLFPTVAFADAYADVSKLDFSVNSIPAIQHALPNASPVKTVLVQVLKSAGGSPADFSDAEVMPDYKVLSLNNDGQAQILCRLDYSGRNRPSVLAAIYKAQGTLKAALLEGGSGEYGLGKIDDLLKDIDGNHKYEVVVWERTFLGKNASQFPGSGPWPEVPDIYVFNQGTFKLSNGLYANYYQNTVIPQLVSDLNRLKAQDPSKLDPEEALTLQTNIQALAESINVSNLIMSAGMPRKANCYGQTVSSLSTKFGGIANAAISLGYGASGIQTLQRSIHTYCGDEGGDKR